MNQNIDYFLAPQSPWTYLGHGRFCAMASQAGATVRVIPVDLGPVFAVSGGLPLGKRAAQRQAYRLVELQRWSDVLQLPLHLKPAYFPVAGDDAARLIIAADLENGSAAALALAGAILAAVWAQQRNIADPAVLAQLLQETRMAAGLLEHAGSPAVQQRYAQNTQQAIDAGVFGAPSYVVDGEMFWGQDRLDFLQRKIRP